MKHTVETVVTEEWIAHVDPKTYKHAALRESFMGLIGDGVFDSTEEIAHFYVKITRKHQDSTWDFHDPRPKRRREYHVLIEVVHP